MINTHTESRPYAAGVYEQSDSGWQLVTWSRHSRESLARRAARRYARELRRYGPSTGGAYTWSAWFRGADGSAVEVTP